MSYGAELKTFEKLSDQIDELASEAHGCDALAPEVAHALDLAWYYAEKAMRDAGVSPCGHIQPIKKPYCACCEHFARLQNKGESLRSRI